MTGWRMATFILIGIAAVWLLMLLTGCAAYNSAEKSGKGPRAVQLAPVCVIACTVVHEQAIGADLAPVSITQERRVRR